MFKDIERIIREAEHFVLTTHVNPDGDGLGSEVAMYNCLLMMKKRPRIINTSPIPKQYLFLNEDNVIEVYDPAVHDELIKKTDVIMVLDISVSKRLDRMKDVVLASPARRICIDHHLDNDGIGHYNCVDEKAPATAELIFNFISYFKQKINYKMARAMYTSLLTDTGGFRFNATRPATHQIASEFLALGVKPNDVYAEVFEQGSPNVMKLLGRTLDRLKAENEGRFYWTFLTQKDFKETNTVPSDTEGFVDYTLKIERSMMGGFFYETSEGFTKISLRSKDDVNVQAFAKTLDGGGHKNASGITLKTPFMDTMKSVLPKIIEYYQTTYGTRY